MLHLPSILLWLSLLAATYCEETCKDFVSCLDVHLNGDIMTTLLKKRQEYIAKFTKAETNPEMRKLSFTHVPKSGGTSVSTFCKKYLKKRYDQPYAHEPYGLADMRSGYKNLFFTVLRHPHDRAVSLYEYIQSSNKGGKISPAESNVPNKFWSYSRNFTSFDVWILQNKTTEYMERQTVEMFDINPSVENRGEFVEQKMKFYKPKINRVTTSKKSLAKNDSESIGPISLSYRNIDYSSYLSYTKSIPVKYQCRDHLKAAVLLITRYVAVGILEDWTQLWLTLFSRAGVPFRYFKKATSTKENVGMIKRNQNKAASKNTAKSSIVRKEKTKQMRNDEIMPCDGLLWYMANAISNHDLKIDGRNSDDIAGFVAAAVEKEGQLDSNPNPSSKPKKTVEKERKKAKSSRGKKSINPDPTLTLGESTIKEATTSRGDNAAHVNSGDKFNYVYGGILLCIGIGVGLAVMGLLSWASKLL